MKHIASVILLLAPLQLLGQDFDYLPRQVAGQQQIVYTQFTISYNEQHEQASWVDYQLTDEEAQMQEDRCGSFSSDERVNTASATDKDHRSSGFNRGHLSPAADNNMSEEANCESFLLSNMSPMISRFNSSIWADLEEWVSQKVVEFDSIYVVTGLVFVNPLGSIGQNEVTVPAYFYKILLHHEEGSPKTIAFLLPQLDAVESLTGLDFFPALDNSQENRVEAQTGRASWG
jgi:endonuclease G